MTAMTCTCGKPVPDHRAHVGYCSGECFESAVFWAIISKPLEAMLRDADATVPISDSPCRRCSGGKVRTCEACCAELVAAAERDAGAETALTSLRAMFDPTTGRPDTSGWDA